MANVIYINVLIFNTNTGLTPFYISVFPVLHFAHGLWCHRQLHSDHEVLWAPTITPFIQLNLCQKVLILIKHFFTLVSELLPICTVFT